VVGPAEWGTCTRTTSVCGHCTPTLTYWNNTIAASCANQDIITFDALTGSQTAALSGHTNYVKSLAFSSDGSLLVSGSRDKTIKLWDVQTGGVIKTFCGHTKTVLSVSISADNTMIASGSKDKTICLWNIGTGEHHVIKEHKDHINTVKFSPTNSQLLLSASKDGTVRQWGIDGHQIGPPYAGSCVAFSSDGAQFVSCAQAAVIVQNTDSGATVAEFHLTNKDFNHCCFSPDGRLIAASAGDTIYLWDITGPDPNLFKTLNGHTTIITSLIFSSSLTLISASGSGDSSVKFWQISTSLADPATPDTEPILPTSESIRSVSLQSKDGLAFSLDSAGVARTWDIYTGLCKEPIKTEAKEIACVDMQLIGGRLIIVWGEMGSGKIHVWDGEKVRLQPGSRSFDPPKGLRITGDKSRVLELTNDQLVLAWSTWTGEPAGRVRLGWKARNLYFDPLRMDGSKVIVHTGESSTQDWDFGIPGSTPIQFSDTSSDRPRLNIRWSNIIPMMVKTIASYSGGPIRIEDRVTGNEVFQLCGRHAEPTAIQWDGQYLITGYESGEVLILDFGHFLL